MTCSDVTGRGAGASRDFWPGNFCWPTGKREWRKNGKMETKTRKMRWKIENRRRKSYKMRRGLSSSSSSSSSFHFLKWLKFVLGLPKWKFSTDREKAFYTGKKIQKNDFAPSEKFSCHAPGDKCKHRGGSSVLVFMASNWASYISKIFSKFLTFVQQNNSQCHCHSIWITSLNDEYLMISSGVLSYLCWRAIKG